MPQRAKRTCPRVRDLISKEWELRVEGINPKLARRIWVAVDDRQGSTHMKDRGLASMEERPWGFYVVWSATVTYNSVCGSFTSAFKKHSLRGQFYWQMYKVYGPSADQEAGAEPCVAAAKPSVASAKPSCAGVAATLSAMQAVDVGGRKRAPSATPTAKKSIPSLEPPRLHRPSS